MLVAWVVVWEGFILHKKWCFSVYLWPIAVALNRCRSWKLCFSDNSLPSKVQTLNSLFFYIYGLDLAHHHHHLSLNRKGWWDTTDDFATSFLHFSLFSAALLDLANSWPVHSLMLFSYLFPCLSSFPFHCALQDGFCQTWWTWDITTTAVCISFPWSGGLRVVRLPARSWHGLRRW